MRKPFMGNRPAALIFYANYPEEVYLNKLPGEGKEIQIEALDLHNHYLDLFPSECLNQEKVKVLLVYKNPIGTIPTDIKKLQFAGFRFN